MARDRNFQRKQKDARMPARDSHGEDRMAARQGEPDFDLRRARDAPSSGNSRNRRQAAPVQAETYGSDISAGHGDSNTAAQDSPTQVFPGQEPTGSEPYVPETGLKESGRGGQGQSNAAYRDSRQKDSGLESPGRRNSAYRDSRQEGPRQEGPERRNSAYQNFRQEESPQENSRQENPGRTAFAEHGPKGADSRYGKIFQEGAGAQKGEEKSGQAGHRSRTRQHGNKYQQRFQEVAKVEEPQEKPPEAAEGETKRPSKLEFTADELPPETADKKLTKARRKAERTAEKLERAENRLPTRRKLRMETSSDPDTGKAKKRLKFEKEVKSQRAHVKGPVPMRPVKAGANTAIGYAHKKIYQAENENVGIKAAHRTELVSESGLRMAYHRHKTAPYRRVAKLQQRSARANARLAYRQTLHDSPELKKNLLARMWQKQKIKRQYAKAAREAKKAGKRAKDTAVTTEKIAAGVVRAVRRHPVICGIVILLLLVFFLIASLFSSFSNLGTGGLGSLAASTYLADDADINNAELVYTEWETDLQMQINRVESDRPGYDEYRYNIGPIEHDPYVLMGYLTSAYQNFTYAQIEGVLRELFNGQYSLSFSEETETRYRTETSVDPETGEETEEEVPYEWHILNVTLTSTPLENLIVSRMNADQKEICEILLQTKGNRQYVKNVFGTNWLPYVTSYYGYRVHPISGGKNYHTGVDIGMPQGTEILAGHDGTVTLAGEAGGYGLCVAIEGEAYEGHSLTTKYGHCSQILVSAGQEVKAGDVIAKVGSTGNSTGPHLHLEVLVDGQYMNPLYFADTGDTSERHLPEAGAGGGRNYFDYDVPPEALADEKFAAMLAEAEKYLGYPYVWGGASPSTSFDCSGYVSWVVNHCGVGWNFGRLTADGLLGVCTPVSSADARPGDLIFFQGTYNTSGASHVGIYVGNGMMIHCGDPISYANINTSYWQQHFYTFGRLP
jgi:murein DD-endopeptidase MepM/ murein hydrolase activator NlpD